MTKPLNEIVETPMSVCEKHLHGCDENILTYLRKVATSLLMDAVQTDFVGSEDEGVIHSVMEGLLAIGPMYHGGGSFRDREAAFYAPKRRELLNTLTVEKDDEDGSIRYRIGSPAWVFWTIKGSRMTGEELIAELDNLPDSVKTSDATPIHDDLRAVAVWGGAHTVWFTREELSNHGPEDTKRIQNDLLKAWVVGTTATLAFTWAAADPDCTTIEDAVSQRDMMIREGVMEAPRVLQ